MSDPWRTFLREASSPLAIAAYIAWAAVWLATLGGLDGGRLLLARVAMVVFLAAFVTLVGLSGRCHGLRYAVLTALMAAAAFTVIALGPSGAAPILLVLLSASLAARLGPRALALALVAVNAGLVWVMRELWQAGWNYILIATAAFGSFQVFAALVMRATARAEAMTQDLRAVNAELLATRSLLEEGARDSERLRLSRELHDVAGHKLTALKLNLATLQRDPALAASAAVRTSAQLVQELLDDIRGVVRALRAHGGIDLSSAIAQLAAPLPDPRVHVEVAPDARPDSIAAAEALLRAAQEALTNAARHAQARNVWISVCNEHERIVLTVRDDGRGARDLQPGLGLAGMRERLEAVDGTLQVDARPGDGVRVRATVPAGTG
ncbi:MAG TPA: ATP-binding protein [Xanthomonadaceae bacterium]|nr:ATP-binding protein [Xanthomonadaceae bacterium]